MGFAAITFLAIFLLIGSGGLLLFYREAMMKRLRDVVTPRSKQTRLKNAFEYTSSSLGDAMGHLERILPKSQAEISVVQQRLAVRAGYRSESAPKILYGAKVFTPAFLALLALVSGAGALDSFIVYAFALGIGYIGPDFWLGRKISKRQNKIRRGLPDVLDLLVMCIEAGLSLDHATARTPLRNWKERSRGSPMNWASPCWNNPLESPAQMSVETFSRSYRGGECAQPGHHPYSIGKVWNECRKNTAHSFRYI